MGKILEKEKKRRLQRPHETDEVINFHLVILYISEKN
uniref:Uncharacterized protein n=1 Tax=Manihot esculenta TaxID=3983 RepID=A0A2C9VNW4_MANES